MYDFEDDEDDDLDLVDPNALLNVFLWAGAAILFGLALLFAL